MRLFFVLIITFLLFSCASKFRKLEKSEDWKVKYQGALAYYDEADYFRAAALFTQIEGIVRGLPEGEQVQFKLAYCNFYEGSYLISSHYFKTFFQTYARSELAAEAEYMYAYSLYANSPIYNLEQSSSVEAIDAMQNFLNKYPDSELKDKATAVIDELQEKLETKAYHNAKQYLRLRRYMSAIMSFENFRKDFPDSHYNEEIAFLKIEAQYEYAEKSLYYKQEERYRKVKSFYEKFIDTYPKSSFLRTAEKYYTTSIDKLAKLASSNEENES